MRLDKLKRDLLKRFYKYKFKLLVAHPWGLIVPLQGVLIPKQGKGDIWKKWVI